MSEAHRSTFRSITLPFIIFTAIWGSTWIVIRGQLSDVPPQWSVAYRFVIAAVAMAFVAAAKGESLRIGSKGALERSSIATNARISAAEPARSPIVSVVPQPISVARVIA